MATGIRKGVEPCIRKTEGVMGGAACIGMTRIPVWLVELHRRWGETGLDLLAYPTLTEEGIQAAWRYAAEHPAEIQEAIDDNQGE